MQDKQVQVFRNHPYLIIRRLIMIAVVVAVAIGKEIGKAIENETAIMKIKDSIWKIGAENRSVVSIIIILILMAAAFIVFYSFFIWKNSVIELHEDYILFFKRGLIVKKRNKVQYKNITNITIKGSLLSGIFRFKTVTCDINSTVTAKTDDYVILLGNEKAQLFRNTVLKLQKKSEGSGRADKREKQSKRKSENINFQFGYSIKQKNHTYIIGKYHISGGWGVYFYSRSFQCPAHERNYCVSFGTASDCKGAIFQFKSIFRISGTTTRKSDYDFLWISGYENLSY